MVREVISSNIVFGITWLLTPCFSHSGQISFCCQSKKNVFNIHVTGAYFLLQPKGKKAKGKKVAPAPSVAKKHEAKKVVNPLFEKRPKNFGIGKSCRQILL